MKRQRPAQGGSALLLALLVVALVAALSGRAHWKQTQAWSVELAEQRRVQSHWLLTGALDWARLILREDARASTVDHLGEPWAVPLAEARVSSFIAADERSADDVLVAAFLAGRVTDLQGQMNLRNLLSGDSGHLVASTADVAAFQKLFAALNLPVQELNALVPQLVAVHGSPTSAPGGALPPQRYGQLAWVGLTPNTLRTLRPHVAWLPERTALNVNTATALTLYASLPGLDMAQAQQFVNQRQRTPFNSLASAQTQLGAGLNLPSDRFSTTSQYFRVQGRLRWDDLVVHETSLLHRDGLQVQTLWRERGPSDDTDTVIRR